MSAFEDVADWCERYLEGVRGREIGMTFGAMLRAYGKLAVDSGIIDTEQQAFTDKELNARAEELLLALSARFIVAHGWLSKLSKPVEPTSMRTNYTYDTGPLPKHETPLVSENAHFPTTYTREAVMSQPRFEIIQKDMGGWVRVYLGRGEPTGEVAQYLSHSLTDWVRKNPQIRVRLIVPINRDGDTVELHAWYDQVIFPDTSGMANPG
ncbi:MAG: hypothetical protein U0796_12675 [Gemmatales bacterium]